MNIGLSVWLTNSSIDVAVLVRRAEELGFESFWLPEHTIPVKTERAVPEVYNYIVDPLIALARASAVTSSIKLATGVCLVAEHQTVRLAREVATLDHLSGGRFELGVGTGWVQEEFDLFGVDAAHRWTQTREAIEAMKLLWGDGEAEYHGKYVSFPAINMAPKPAQRPHPPIYLGSRHERVFERVVAHADGWMPINASTDEVHEGRQKLDRLARAAGRDPAAIEVIAYAVWPQDFDKLSAYEDAGAGRIIVRFDTGPEAEVLDRLEKVAERVLR